MKFLKGIVVLSCVILFSSSGFAGTDPFWMFSDEHGLLSYSPDGFKCHDTERTTAVGIDAFTWLPVDTPAANTYDGSSYIDFNYQFNLNPIIYISDSNHVNIFDTTSPMHYDTAYTDNPRPGYAGFKTAWDGGMTGFPLSRYKKLFIPHKGPLSTHKVSVSAWYNGGNCGDPSYKEYLGTLTTSQDQWIVDSIVFPDSFQSRSDKRRNGSKYFELVFVINNADAGGPDTSAPGNFSFDEMRLQERNPIDQSPLWDTMFHRGKDTVAVGKAETLFVVTSQANVDTPVTYAYQWKKNGMVIFGATDSTFPIYKADTVDAGVYTVDVTVPTATGSLTFTSQSGTLIVPAPSTEKKSCGCGSGTGLAILPPFFFKAMANRRRKKARAGRA